ncbi:DUF982 domain-containing protein [Rhizobium sp. VS19-DR104.2]|uniref:DUF982 domain-containing protein n=1 Tax=unclassified Rhizobium TaxID=2613769 RepID=UPI001CC7F13F|nr:MULTISPECIES: DUF982 domain-containing protein [unclassified Rhizobium]MBZ5757968.1 DUF982 domain-containing protein [Rhizobium sp. VS19-DR96]MBZ5765202.1 DUF982 domain-containing protein [Rhizobium sp. VS19-DR129.2]MBZ5772745.1 DUF982 domain-containing protein [Rhizobium sp. VS19-DRK62.2]MBZ5782568.1 DUF982 domain-containing protein [Rhizobium sp. VS19-DR121]MBZ5800016.1 DUF982 domain-containing protein [Rhizobium sp. VS19-DR181]
MLARMFDKPLYLRRGHITHEINDLEDAMDFLEAWPDAEKGMTYEMALKACDDAYIGKIPIDAARETLEIFARKESVLSSVEELLPKIKLGGGGMSGPGGPM